MCNFYELNVHEKLMFLITGVAGTFVSEDAKKLEEKLNEKEVAEVAFMIYVPQGSSLKTQDTRKSTWLNPLVDGKEAKKLMGWYSV